MKFWKVALLHLYLLAFSSTAAIAQKHTYSIELFGKKIGSATTERIDKGNGEFQYKLNSQSEANILLTKKTSLMIFDVLYRDGKLISSYCKNVKDGVTEVVTIGVEGGKYLIRKGEDVLHYAAPIDFSAIHLYFTEPKGRTRIFSERLAELCTFKKISEGVYECKLSNGVNNIYRYRNGVLYELEMSKGASVFMRLVK